MALHRRCINHTQTPANWECSSCHKVFCEACVEHREVRLTTLQLCPSCGEICHGLEVDLALETPTMHWFLDSFSFPLRGEGRWTLAVGLFCIFVAQLSIALRLRVALALTFLFVGALCAYLMDIVLYTAQGQDEVPAYQDFSSIGEDLIWPLLYFLLTFAVSFGPWIALGITLRLEGLSFLLLQLPGVFYFPMALIAISVFRKLLALNPLTVVVGILHAGWQYFGVTALMGMIFFSYVVISEALVASDSFFLSLLSNLVFFYLLLVLMRLTGMLYRTRKYQLGWMFEDQQHSALR